MLKILSSYYLMIALLLALAIGAAIATFVENDFGTEAAREYVYNALWYEALLVLSAVNLVAVIVKTKLFRDRVKFIFHIAFVVILIGAGLTRYMGYEGSIHIREGETTDVTRSLENRDKVTLPFSLRLKDFQMERYPGSAAPSTYSSFVTVVDKDNDREFDFHIYMNHTLDYRGYKFFQTSYDVDEGGTILTVNKDPGKIPTYIGYGLLFLGLILNLFDLKSRFQKLFKRANKEMSFVVLLALLVSPDLKANEYIDTYKQDLRQDSIKLSKEFGRLVVQSRMGRMKPLDTLNREIVRKLTGSTNFQGMSANQVVLGMFTRQRIWKSIPIIKVKSPQIKETIGLEKNQKLATFKQFFGEGGVKYLLESEVANAHSLKPSERGTFEKDLIRVDERLNIAFMVYFGSVFKLFPLPEDTDKRWLDFKDMWQHIEGEDADRLRTSVEKFMENSFNRNYDDAIKYVEDIKKFQRDYGDEIMPSEEKISQEIFLNELNIFERLTPVYVLFGVVLLILAFASIFFKSILNKKLYYTILAITTAIFALHTFGLGARWYISGHAPFSDTYESIIYIAYSAMIGGIFFFRRSLFALGASVLMAGIFMFAGHLSHVDPEITNLVPVLKSFWLTIHVSVITASYGFLGIGALLGFFTLILFILKSRKDLKNEINHLTDLNEISLVFGLILLVIGNFLGGIWANESWGRYWGWDPKETWSYISIIVYVLIIHLRLATKVYSKYLFAALSLVGFASILMTYFGVNFYLAGMHSYATGDPVPIPSWVYYIVGLVSILILLSFKNRDKKQKGNQ